MYSYHTGLELQGLIVRHGKSTIAQDLWQMTRARKTPNGYLGLAARKINLWNPKIHLYDRSRPSVVLSPRLVGAQWHIQAGELLIGENVNSARTEKSHYIWSRPVQVTLRVEALLEQIAERDGIYCPYYRISPDVKACPCDPGYKQALLDLLRWAREGKFGPGGTWRDLPPECCSGV
jgi:hypothetical protein